MIDANRHVRVFNPHTFGNKQIDIVGVGATGSRVAMSLAKLGLEKIVVHDFDKVEEHNVANQIFGNNDIGKYKVDALYERVLTETGTKISISKKAVTGVEALGAVVFLLTDSMASRKEIWENGLKYKLRTKLMVETRMGPDCGRVYAVDPNARPQVSGWEATLCADNEAEVSACGASISVGPTADVLSGLAVWQLINWHNWSLEPAKNEAPANEIIYSLRPTVLIASNFKV